MKSKKQTKILFIGGHFTPALAVLNELKNRGYNNFIWIGHKYTMLRDKETSSEYKEITKIGIPFFNIKTGKLYRYFSVLGVVSLLRIPIGFIQSLIILLSERPQIVISFGGYIAVPVVISAWILRIPRITHEQTVSVGLSNKIVSKFANKILISFNESKKYFSSNNTILTGNPIRTDIYTHDKNFVDFKNSNPTILVLGGNQGSHIINENIKLLLPLINNEFNIIHQAGSNTIFNDYDNLVKLERDHANYKVFKGIWGEDIGRALSQSDLVISRSGANTVYELGVLSKTAILIPLPYSVNNEQFSNAKILVELKIGIILEEKDLTPENLLKEVKYAFSLKKNENPNERELLKKDAQKTIADIIESFIK